MMNREAAIDRLKSEKFDLLVIGGGATGAGIAVDAASRGLSVALVERADFSSGTSSRSTKLVHGGVRYLELAVKQMDRGQYKLVREALHERTTLLKIAPHLVRPLELLTPLHGWFEAPYYWSGLQLYDWVAGKSALNRSRYLNKEEAVARFPMLDRNGLKGAVVYSDGQFNDSRMNVTLALTAHEQGAAVANHVGVRGLLKEKDRIAGAHLRDELTGKEWEVRAKIVINATGPFVDGVRQLDDAKAAPLLTASSGAHVVLDGSFSAPDTGLLIPKTRDGRVLFVLPWLGHTLVGTTDNPARITDDPKATEEDIAFILKEMARHVSKPARREDVKAAWSGLRPLVSDPKASDTAGISRDHTIHVSPSGLVTVTGGKWTTYRRMAADAVTLALRLGEFPKVRPETTTELLLAGAERYSEKTAADLVKKFDLPADVAEHLAHSYGSRADRVAKLMAKGHHKRLAKGLPYVEAEVLHGVREESARTTADVIHRRTRLGFLDAAAARAAWPRVVELLEKELHWSEKRSRREAAEAGTLQA